MSKRSSGEGTIVKRADGRWAGAISLPDGRRKWCYGTTQHEVARKLVAIRHDRDGGLPISSERRTVEDYLQSWLEMRKPSLRPGAHENYAWYCRKYIIPTIGKISLARLTGEHVQRLLSERLSEGLAPSTVRYTHAILRNALNEAVALGLIPRNVALLVKKPRARRIEMRCWDPEQARAFLVAARGDRLYALYLVALSTGMREGELLALRWRDVRLPATGEGALGVQNTLHWRNGRMSIEEVKTPSGRRQIHLSAQTTEALRQHRQRQCEERAKAGPIWRDNDLVFCTTVGGAIHVSNFRRQSFARLVSAAGVPYIRPYDMRHTAATLLLLAGIHPKVVSELLGHSSVTITLTIYSHVLPVLQRDAATAMNRLLGDEEDWHGGPGEPRHV
jgi:integrase